MLRSLPAIPLVLILLSSGCRTPGESRPSVDTSIPPSGRTRPEKSEDPLKGNHWLQTPGGTVGSGGTKPLTGVVTPGDANFKSEVKGLLAGYVVTAGGKNVRKATITVEPVNNPGEATIDYDTMADGSFMISGLTTGKSYRLTVRHNDEGVISAGQVLVQVPNVYVRINLVEGLELSPTKPAEKKAAAEVPKPEPKSKTETETGAIPKPDKKTDPLKYPDAFIAPLEPVGPLPTPGGSTSSLPSPQPIIRDTNLNPNRRTDLPLDDWSPTQFNQTAPGTAAPTRPDLNTKLPNDGFRPPVVDLPPLPGPNRQESRRPSADDFFLIDSAGKERRFPMGKPGELLLVEFMTTTCLPCQKALPTLTAVQARYANRGLQVVGVTCDDEELRTRIIYANKYRVDHAVNFPILTEPGKAPGTVMKRFGVRVYPTTVLLDSTGSVLWQGNPGNAKAMVAAIEANLSK